MDIKIFGKESAPKLLLIPGLGVSYEIFLPLIRLVEQQFYIIAVQVNGFILGKKTRFSSVDAQSVELINYVKKYCNGHIDCAYGLSLGGKILSHIMEKNEIVIDHAILDAAPLLPLPRWLEMPIRYFQCFNVWTCFHCTGFWKWVFRSHYFDVLLDECKKVYPFGGGRAVLDAYKSVYNTRLNSITGQDIHYWYGTKEAFVAKSQVNHLISLCPDVHVEVFQKMNHGQLLIDNTEEVARKIQKMVYFSLHLSMT